MDKCALRSGKVALGLLCVACASTAPPSADLRDTYESLARAEGAGGAHTRELALAREKVSLAERYFAAGEDKIASWLLEQARADAELAAIEARP